VLGTETLEAVADRGYFSGPEMGAAFNYSCSSMMALLARITGKGTLPSIPAINSQCV
jgi:hypothetical protein